MDPQQLDLHFVLGQERPFDLVRQVRQDLPVCAHQWAPDLHPNQVTVPHLLHVRAVVPVVGDIPHQQGHLIEVVLQQLQAVQVLVAQEVDQELVVPVVQVVPVEKRVDHDKDKNPRKLVARRLIIYVRHLSVERLFRMAMEVHRSNFVAVHLLLI